jgi:hypothetical protein
MIILLSIVTVISAVIFSIQLEVPQTVVSTMCKTRELYKYISIYNKKSKNKSVITRLYTTCNIIYTIAKVYICQLFNGNIKKLDNKTFEVSYVIHGHLYKMIVIPKRGPNNYVLITNEDGVDVSSTIVPYMGSRYDFHRHPFTPRFFGYKSLVFHNVNGDESNFDEDEILIV